MNFHNQSIDMQQHLQADISNLKNQLETAKTAHSIHSSSKNEIHLEVEIQYLNQKLTESNTYVSEVTSQNTELKSVYTTFKDQLPLLP